MQRIDVLVDEIGGVWEVGLRDLLLRHGLVGSKSDLPAYLVRNAGHVRISKSTDRSIARIVLHTGRIGARTVTTAVALVMKWKCEEFHVEVLGRLPHIQTVFGLDELVALLVYNTNEDCGLKRPKFYRASLSFERLELEPHLIYLNRMFKGWAASHGVLDDIEVGSQVFPPAQYYLAPVERGSATFDVIGDGYPTLKPLLASSLGECVSKQSDAVYGGWVAECVLEVAHYDEPVFETVEADVVLPAGDHVRSRYQRLMLPWVGHRGHVISCASITLSTFRSAT